MNRKNWFWGIIFVLAAVLIIAGQFTSFASVGVWSILAGVALVAGLVSSLKRLNFVGAFFAAALLYVVFQTPMGFPYLSPWILLLAAVLAGSGINMLIRRNLGWGCGYSQNQCQVGSGETQDYADQEYTQNEGHRPEMKREANEDDNHPVGRVTFGSANRYLHSTALEYGQFSVSFGAMEVYFDQADLAPGGAEVKCDVSFGAIELYVPRHWQVDDKVSTFMGGMEHNVRHARPEQNAPRLTITGNASFGAVEVRYV